MFALCQETQNQGKGVVASNMEQHTIVSDNQVNIICLKESENWNLYSYRNRYV